jgi:uncharacterized C2H2 Zn-finger protein
VGEDIVRIKKVRTAIYDEFGNLLKYEEHDVELHETPARRSTSRSTTTSKPKVEKLPYLGIGKPPREAGAYSWPWGSRKEDIPIPRRGSQRPVTPHLTECPKCGLKVRTRRLEIHMARAHPVVKQKKVKKSAPKPIFQRWNIDAQVSPPNTKPQFVTCPECQVTIRQDRLDKHLRKAHGPKAVASVTEPADSGDDCNNADAEKILPKPDAQTQFQSFNDPKSFVACPVCSVSVRNDHLGKHLRKVHFHPSTKMNNAPAKAGKALAKGRTSATFEHSRVEREQDGSKNIGYLARERGRYGSHPMHDDYSDEGGAD